MAGWMWRLYHATKDGRLFNYPVHLSRSARGSRRPGYPAVGRDLTLQDVSGCQRLDIEVTKWNILEVFFIDIHLFAPAAASTSAACLSALTSGGGAVVRVAGSAEELHVVGDDVHLAPLGAVLGLPGTVLPAPFEKDGVALLLVVGDGLAELAPRAYVEEIDLLAARPHPVDREPERADGYAVVGETQFWIPCQIASQYDAIETDHVSLLLLCALQG